jgi:hypothetical protein
MEIETSSLRSRIVAAVTRAVDQGIAEDPSEIRLCLCDPEYRPLVHFSVHGVHAMQRIQQELAELGYRWVALKGAKQHPCDVLLVAGKMPEGSEAGFPAFR